VFDYSENHAKDVVIGQALVDFYWLFKENIIGKKGGDVPSVTTILKVLDKPALPQWAANCARESLCLLGGSNSGRKRRQRTSGVSHRQRWM
jgi:hypothetical protein